MKLSEINDSVYSVVLELIHSGECKSLPFPEHRLPKVGEVICLESIDGAYEACGIEYAYVQVKGIYNYYQRGSMVKVDGLKLVVFDLVENLSKVSVG